MITPYCHDYIIIIHLHPPSINPRPTHDQMLRFIQHIAQQLWRRLAGKKKRRDVEEPLVGGEGENEAVWV